MMGVSKCALTVVLCLTLSGLPGLPALAQETPPPPPPAEPAPPGPPPITLSLTDAIQMSLKNNLDAQFAAKTPLMREQDLLIQEAFFDPNIGGTAFKQDSSRPSQNVFDIGAIGTIVSIDSTATVLSAGFSDPLTWGARYSANLEVDRFTSTSRNAVFPTTYQAFLELVYDQSLLRGWGRDVNRTQIVIARNTLGISRSAYRDQVFDVLRRTEDAYWELVFARQDLDVNLESLKLANELLKLNRIKVQVGTLPPIEITTADAEVASREQNVIVAENTVRNAEDTLREVINMPKADQAWFRPIVPAERPTFVERPVDLEKELEEALARRPDLEQARLNVETTKTQLAFDRKQLRWDLNFRGTYRLEGLAGDVEQRQVADTVAVACDDSGIDGIPATGDAGEGDGICEAAQPATGATPAGPGEGLTLSTVFLNQFSPSDLQNESALDALEFIRDREFETWSASLNLNIPVGNNAAQAAYVSSRLAKEQAEINYENLRLKAEVDVRSSARAIDTNRKRIQAAEKNVELQKKKVEAEQKKFENGMSTSFQVLEFQEDLTTALGQLNRALVDYRKSLTALERAKGTLDDYLDVEVQ